VHTGVSGNKTSTTDVLTTSNVSDIGFFSVVLIGTGTLTVIIGDIGRILDTFL